MLGVMFGSKHSYLDWGLLLKSYPEISPPEPKTKYVDIPGTDGELDLTELLTGFVQYKSREISFEFTILRDRSEWASIYSDIYDHLHGKRMDIILDDDPDYAYRGRISVDGRKDDKRTTEIKLTALVEPYKVKLVKKTVSVDIQGSRQLMVVGSRKPVVPSFTSSAAITMLYNGKEFHLPKGNSQFSDVIIREGNNAFSFVGTGSVSMSYQEGRF